MADDKSLYDAGFWDDEWPRPLVSAAIAMYGRLSLASEDPKPFKDLDIDTQDHYIIAARHAVRAFYRSAEGKDDGRH